MKICIFAKYLPIHLRGGMEIHIQDLVNGLIKRGHKVTIITAPHPKGIKKEEKENLAIYYLKSKPKYLREKFYKESAELFEKVNKQEKFDIVHSQSTLACGYAKYCKKEIPIVVTLHGISSNDIKSLLKCKSLARFFLMIPFYLKTRLIDEPILFRKADKIIAVSKELEEDIKIQYKIPEEKLIVIPNGVDTNKFKPLDISNLKEKLNIKDEKVIVSCGTIRREKGFHLLIKILPEISRKQKVKLIIIGNGPYLENLKKMSVQYKVADKVLFIGSIPHENLPIYYNLADIFVFVTFLKEAFPLVVIEAMACARPVIASKIGGIPTAIENYRDGILIEPGNLKELKEKILEVLRDESLSKKLKKNARQKAIEKFSLDKMVDDTIKVYQEVIQ